MGMDNFNITLLYDNVTIVREREFWKLGGVSNYMVREVHDYLIMMCDTKKMVNIYMMIALTLGYVKAVGGFRGLN